MARRNFTPRENEIVFAGARAGLARTVIVEQLRAEGFVRSPDTLRTAHGYVAGRQAAADAVVRAAELRRSDARAAALRRGEHPDRIRVNGISLPRLSIQAGWTGAFAPTSS